MLQSQVQSLTFNGSYRITFDYHSKLQKITEFHGNYSGNGFDRWCALVVFQIGEVQFQTLMGCPA